MISRRGVLIWKTSYLGRARGEARGRGSSIVAGNISGER